MIRLHNKILIITLKHNQQYVLFIRIKIFQNRIK